MITNFNQENSKYPDNVDWTKNNLIFVNKDDYGTGGVWYMNPDGSDKVNIGRTRDGGESTGILDVSDLLNYPPASAMITTNQGTPSSMTLLLNPNLKQFLAASSSNDPYTPVADPVATPVPASIPTNTAVVTNKPMTPPIRPPTMAPAAKPPPPTTPPIKPIIPNYDNTADCPISDKDGLFQVIQAEDATLYSALIKTKADFFCGIGYVDFENIRKGDFASSGIDGAGGASGSSIGDELGKNPFFPKKDDLPVVSRQGDIPNFVVGISFKVEITFPGIYWITIRYANGGGLNKSRPGVFLVDDVDAGDDFEFPTTFGWDIWSLESKSVSFETDGSHTLDIVWTKTENRPNMDWVSIELGGNSID